MNTKKMPQLRLTLSWLAAGLGIGYLLIATDKCWATLPPVESQDSSRSAHALYYGWYAQAAENSVQPGNSSSVAAAPAPVSIASSHQSISSAALKPLASEATSEARRPTASLSSPAPEATPQLEPAIETAQSLELDAPLNPPETTELDGIAPADTGQTIADVQVRFLNRKGEIVEGHTRPSVFTRELDLQAGTAYEPAIAQQGLDQINNLAIVRDADIVLEPLPNSEQVTLVVLVVERNPFVADLGIVLPAPSALEGPFQRNPVLGIGPDEVTGLAGEGNLRFLNLGGNDQDITLQLRGGETVFDTELAFTDPWIGNGPTGISINVFNQRSIQGVFSNGDGDRDVDLPNDNTPWVHRIGGGIEVFRPVTPNFTIAAGVNYQEVSIHNSAFETDTFTRDQLGERLTVSDTGYDDLLTVSLSADLDRRDDPNEPSRGSRLRLGIDQSIPIGDANINYTRLSANYSEFVPLNLFGFAEGPRTLVLNAQAGTMFGEVPPYDAFNLNSGILRGYAGNSIGTGSSFALFAAEYRFPIANFRIFRRDVRLGGTLFGGYGTILGTGDEVIGQPSVSREKPGDGFGYGLGLRALTDFGILRLEFSLGDKGDGQVAVTVGNRF